MFPRKFSLVEFHDIDKLFVKMYNKISEFHDRRQL